MNPQHGWFRITWEREGSCFEWHFFLPQHLLLWNFSHKLIVIHFAVTFFSVIPSRFFCSFLASWKCKKFTNYEIMTRSSDNAIAIINWIWTWNDLQCSWLIFSSTFWCSRLSLWLALKPARWFPGRLHFQIAKFLVKTFFSVRFKHKTLISSTCFALWYL